jgi:cobalamin-dependent methionine synthase I
LATFNQQNQSVQNQFNGEQINVGSAAQPTLADVERMIDDLVHRLRRERDRKFIADAVIDRLEAARAASSRGDTGGVWAALKEAAEVAAPLAMIATNLTAIMNQVTTWHG